MSYKTEKKESKNPYSEQIRSHSKQDWINYRQGIELCHIVPPFRGWVDEKCQELKWLERQKEYTMIADLRLKECLIKEQKDIKS